jgi:hypothetical protein
MPMHLHLLDCSQQKRGPQAARLRFFSVGSCWRSCWSRGRCSAALRFALSLALRATGWIPWLTVWPVAVGVWAHGFALTWWTWWTIATWAACGLAFRAWAAWATWWAVEAWATWWQRLAVSAEAWWARAAWAIAAWAAWTAVVTTRAARAAFAAAAWTTAEIAWCRGQLPAEASAWHFTAGWTVIVVASRLGIFFRHQAAEAFRFVAIAARAFAAAGTTWAAFATVAAAAFAAIIAATVVVAASRLGRRNKIDDVVEFATRVRAGWCGFALENANQANAFDAFTDDFDSFEQTWHAFSGHVERSNQRFGECVTFESSVGGFGSRSAAQRESGEFGQSLHSGGA